jgi:metallophosphoesterase (TIGR03767 family)
MRAVPGAVLSLAAGALLALAGPPATTVSGTILDTNGDNRLEQARGEARIVRTELATRPSRPGPASEELLFFAQMTDVHVVDEESPARVELADRYGGSVNAAYRPQDALTTQVAEMAVRQLRRARSSGGRPLDLVLSTGDGIDNTQLNELRWFIDLLDGGKTITPDSGRPGTCGARHRGAYEGVRGGGHYYEPDRSGPGVDGPGYLPSQHANARRTGRTVAMRDFPGLLGRAERSFRATGLGVPWYAVIGNHDALVQGNVAWNPVFAQGAIGCIKPTRLSAKSLKEIAALARGGITAAERLRIIQLLAGDLVFTILAPERSKGQFIRVESDPARRLLLPGQVIEQFFTTSGRPVGHGFTADDVARGQGNYAFSPTSRIRFVVLDSAADSGDGGNIDDAQFRWAHEQLLAADANRQLAVVVAHHRLESMTQRAPGVHLGRGTCATTNAAAAPAPDEPLECLLLRHPSVIAFVAGHSHVNQIRPVTGGAHGFWQIVTPANNDWPQQSRLIEIRDNRDGTLSLLATVVDHGGPARPGPWRAGPGRGLLPPSGVAQLASISRELAFNDPQGETGENGTANRRGGRPDRNVELVIRNPY